ncbi:MAG: methyltransferase [Actinomycetota bacterium]|nr:methyltransferase [Actinomycetota bacterium]
MDSQSHYFDEEPMSLSETSTVDLTLPDLTATLVTDRGVFSSSRIDPGTKYLLQNAPTPDGTVETALDLGCGYGPIARTLVHRFPKAEIWATDVNSRARLLTEKNVGGLGVNVEHPDNIDDSIRFDLIWSNPPIRIGKTKLYEMLDIWLQRLSDDGEAILVVQKHLGADSLAKWLATVRFQVDRLSSKSGYRLLKVTVK